jgi:hypothetical protein
MGKEVKVMTELQRQAMVAGIGFGIWPILMNLSGLRGNLMSAVYGIACLVFILPFALRDGVTTAQLAGANWWAIVPAAMIGTIGLLSFNAGLAKSTPQTVGTFFVMMILVQIATPAIYHVVRNGLSTYKLIGFMFAVVAAYFLNKQ